MGVTLAKGGNVSLSKAAPNLTQIMVGLGWDARSTTGAPFDLDASALLCGSGRVLGDEYFVFYNNLKSPEGSVEHTGDNLTGEGEGDDESILVDLSKVPERCDKIVFPVSIHDAEFAARASARSATPSSASSTRPTAGTRALRPQRGRLQRNGDDLRRALPLQRRVEVPGGGPGVRVGTARHRSRLRGQRFVKQTLCARGKPVNSRIG